MGTFITENILSEGGITGTTISGTTILGNGSQLTGISGTSVTGLTYSNNFITVANSNGNNYSAQITGFTGTTTFQTVSATTISGTTLYGDGSQITGISTQTPSSKLFNYYNFI